MSILSQNTLPVYRQICDMIKEDITRGRLTVGAPVLSVRKMARKVGVSQTTVSHAYSELTRRGVLRAERGLGMFVANHFETCDLPIGLLCGFSRHMLDRSPRGSYFGDFHAGFRVEVLRVGRQCLTYGNQPLDRFVPGDARRVAGAVVFENFSFQDILDFKRLDVPCVVADMDVSLAGIDSVVTDNTAALVEAVRTVAQRGARRIAFLHLDRRAYPHNWDPALDHRLDGVRLGAQALGLPEPEVLYPVTHGAEAGRACVETWLRRTGERGAALPDAILATNDTLAWSAFDALQAHGVRVPEQVMVVGFGRGGARLAADAADHPADAADAPADVSQSTLASLTFDAVELGRRAAVRIIQRLDDPLALPTLEKIPGLFVEGTTVRQA